jgi:hypothetical protein
MNAITHKHQRLIALVLCGDGCISLTRPCRVRRVGLAHEAHSLPHQASVPQLLSHPMDPYMLSIMDLWGELNFLEIIQYSNGSYTYLNWHLYL